MLFFRTRRATRQLGQAQRAGAPAPLPADPALPHGWEAVASDFGGYLSVFFRNRDLKRFSRKQTVGGLWTFIVFWFGSM